MYKTYSFDYACQGPPDIFLDKYTLKKKKKNKKKKKKRSFDWQWKATDHDSKVHKKRIVLINVIQNG